MRAMKTLCVVLFASLLAAASPAQETTGSIEIAGRGTGKDGNMNRAAEYRVTDPGGELRFDLEALFEGGYLALNGDVLHSEDQKYSLDFEIGRMVRSHTSFTRLPHRLEHDPLNNLRGAVKEGSVATWSTDLEPDARYDIRYDLLEHQTDFQFSGIGWLTVSAHFREQNREGHKQSLAVSHCSSCHVQSQGRAVNESTRDGGVSARAAFGAWSIKGTYMDRDFRERGATPTRTYELAEHPKLRKPVFNDRVQYDLRDGELPYDMVPTTEKQTSKLEVNGDLSGLALSFTGITSKVTNKETKNHVKYDALGVMFGRRLGKKGRFSLRGRAYQIGSKDYFYDTVEPVAVAGPYAGQTYREHYGIDPDYLRRSAIDREVLEFFGRYTQRLGKRHSLTGNYDIRQIKREHYEVAPGKTDTMEQKARLTYSTRAAKGLSFRTAVTFYDAKRPFMILDGACNPDELQTDPAASPMAGNSNQYYQIHDARAADLTASPAEYWEVRLNGSYQLTPNSVATLMYRWWDGDNYDLDYTDWSRTLNTVTGALAIAPAEHWQLFFAASYNRRKMDTHICIPLMDG